MFCFRQLKDLWRKTLQKNINIVSAHMLLYIVKMVMIKHQDAMLSHRERVRLFQ